MLDLQPIKDRLAVATCGTWTRTAVKDAIPQGYRSLQEWWKPFGPEAVVEVAGKGRTSVAECVTSHHADLIANAPQDLAALVAEVERLRAAIANHKRRVVIDPQPWDRDLWEVLE